MKILKQAKSGYVPTVDFGYYGFKRPIYEIQITLKQLPTDAELDALRIALKRWAFECGYGELKQGAE